MDSLFSVHYQQIVVPRVVRITYDIVHLVTLVVLEDERATFVGGERANLTKTLGGLFRQTNQMELPLRLLPAWRIFEQ